jgi:hypothetical protein
VVTEEGCEEITSFSRTGLAEDSEIEWEKAVVLPSAAG